MFNKDFYPTPNEIGLQMLKDIRGNRHTILEPSAGKGDLVKSIREKFCGGYNGMTIHMIEKEPELRSILRDLDGCSLVDSDFLGFAPQQKYDYIIMNPPFSNGIDHLIHAFEIGNGAEIRCLLNSDTVSGSSTKAKMLRTIIDDNDGSIEELGSCFQDSERKTNVNVCLITLKSEVSSQFDFEFDPKFDREREDFDFSDRSSAQLAIKGNVFEDYEMRYNLAKKAYAELLKKGNEFVHYASSISTLPTSFDNDSYNLIWGGSGEFDVFCSKFRKSCWEDLFMKTKIAQILPSDVKKTFMDNAEKQGAMNFTAKNMRELFMDLYNNKEGILQSCVESSFDKMTKYHSENRVHFEGWKSNDRWQVSRKVVLPNMRDHYATASENHVDFNYGNWEKLHDIFLGLCWMVGKKIEDVNVPPRQDRDLLLGKWHDSEFFEWKMFKKGTLHLRFKDENLWKKFNIQACSAKNWLKGS